MPDMGGSFGTGNAGLTKLKVLARFGIYLAVLIAAIVVVALVKRKR